MRRASWVTRAVVGIVLATFFSDVGHEMVTAVLPLYLDSIGLGAAALGAMEGVADLLFSLAKLAGGAFGHRVRRKKPWVALGYLATTLGSAAMALVRGAPALAALRGVAWVGRGFRSPLRDFLLADEVGKEHFGRAYGFERSADMLGAVAGPLLAVVLVASGASFTTVIAASVGPSLLSVLSIVLLTRDRDAPGGDPKIARAPLPRRFWLLLVGVLLFGLGDFSRSFLVFLAARAAGEHGARGVSTAVLLYVVHNAVSALVAYPVGRLGDRKPKLLVLAAGYAGGAVVHAMLAWKADSLPWLAVVVLLSGAYLAVEETIEKAACAELLPRGQRSLGLGILACANAVGDMVSSIGVGLLLARGDARLAFGVPAILAVLGASWVLALGRRAAPERR
jgi:MFS family permease